MPKVAHIADMVSDSVLIDVFNIESFVEQFFKACNCLNHRHTVFTSTADVVNCGDTGLTVERFKKRTDVIGVNVITYLLPFVTIDTVGAAFRRGTGKVGEKAVQFGPRVIGTSKTSTTQANG